MGLDEAVELPKQRRDRNATVDERYESAALRFMGCQWKEIAARHRYCSTEEDLNRAEIAVGKAPLKFSMQPGWQTGNNRRLRLIPFLLLDIHSHFVCN